MKEFDFNKDITNESDKYLDLRNESELDIYEFFQKCGPYIHIDVASASWYDSIPRVVVHNGSRDYPRIWGSVNFNCVEEAKRYKEYLETVQFRAEQFLPEDSIWKK